MIESLSDGGECDYDSCDDDNGVDNDSEDEDDEDDDDGKNHQLDESTATKLDTNLLVERSLCLAYTPFLEKDDANSTCQSIRTKGEGGVSIDGSDIIDDAKNTTKQNMDLLVERSLRLAPTPCQEKDNARVTCQPVNVDDEGGRLTNIIDYAKYTTKQDMELLVERSLRLALTSCQEKDDAQSTCQPVNVENEGGRSSNIVNNANHTTQRVMELLVERGLRLAPTPCHEKDDVPTTHQSVNVEDEGEGSIDFSDIIDSGKNMTKQDMDLLVERSLRLVPTPYQEEDDARLKYQLVSGDDKGGMLIGVRNIIEDGSMSLSPPNNLTAPTSAADVVLFCAMDATVDKKQNQVPLPTDLNADETCKNNLLIVTKETVNTVSDRNVTCLTSESEQMVLSGAELLKKGFQNDEKVALHSSSLDLHEGHAVAIPLAEGDDAMISRIGYEPLPKIGDGFTLMAAETTEHLSDTRNEQEQQQQRCINMDVEFSPVATALDTKNHNRGKLKKGENSLAGNEAMTLTNQSPAPNQGLIVGFHIKIHESSSSFALSEVSSSAVSIEEAQTLEKQRDVLILQDKPDGFIADVDAKKSGNTHHISVSSRGDVEVKIGEIFENKSSRTVRAVEQDFFNENENDGMDQKGGHHNDGGVINSPSHKRDDLIVNFRDREAAQGEQNSEYSASSKSYEDFLSFTMTTTKRSDEETLSEVMSMISTSSSQAKKVNAAKRLSKLWNRSPRGTLDGKVGGIDKRKRG